MQFQAYFNYRRKSTVGWSIGNVLLDFTGGTLDILQMILQASNVNNWSAFYGNPVKVVVFNYIKITISIENNSFCLKRQTIFQQNKSELVTLNSKSEIF